MEGSPRIVKKEKIIAFPDKVYLLHCHSLFFSVPFKPTFRRIFPQRVNEGNKQNASFFSAPAAFEIVPFLAEALNRNFLFPLIFSFNYYYCITFTTQMLSSIELPIINLTIHLTIISESF